MERWSINQETLSRLSIDFAAICRACWINILYRVIDCLFEKCRRFVLMVRKGYRDPPYHNWMHAFSVFHFTYVLIKRLRLVQQEYLT
jgi:cGMP-dependent 3',5'-cyclic phosphodiesterase